MHIHFLMALEESRIENARIEYLKSNLELVDAKREYEQNIKSFARKYQSKSKIKYPN